MGRDGGAAIAIAARTRSYQKPSCKASGEPTGNLACGMSFALKDCRLEIYIPRSWSDSSTSKLGHLKVLNFMCKRQTTGPERFS